MRNVSQYSAIIEAAGYTPTVIEYLKTGWTKSQLLGLFAAVGLTPRTTLRETKSPAAELGLLAEDVSGGNPRRYDQASHTGEDCLHTEGVRLCRPSETVLDLLDRLPPGPFQKEDGELLIDHEGRRVG